MLRGLCQVASRGIGSLREPEEETEQPQTNPDQILVAQEFERRPKPTETGIEEFLTGNITYRYKEEETPPEA